MTTITGAVFVAMAWLDPFGPLAMILGSGCCAVALESKLGIDDWQHPAAPQPVATLDADEVGQGAVA